jgi:putative addiction module CopG family antidote
MQERAEGCQAAGAMTQVYIPGPEADAIVDELLALGRYTTPEEVVRAALQLLCRQDAELEALMRRVGASDAEIAADQKRWRRYARGDEGALDDDAGGIGDVEPRQ